MLTDMALGLGSRHVEAVKVENTKNNKNNKSALISAYPPAVRRA